MTHAEFKAACEAAIAPHHDPELDGPLLVGVRENTIPSVLRPGTRTAYSEYAATIGAWPDHVTQQVGHGHYREFEQQAVAEVAAYAQQLQQQRQPEPAEGRPRDHYDDLLS